jgi:hypothetical protein
MLRASELALGLAANGSLNASVLASVVGEKICGHGRRLRRALFAMVWHRIKDNIALCV